MSPLLAAVAAPAALSAARTVGHVVGAGVGSFADALSGAIGSAPQDACEDCDAPSEPTLRERLEERLGKVLAPFWGNGDSIGVSLDGATGELEVSGDSPAAQALAQALANDPQLQSDLQAFINENGPGATPGEDSFFDTVWPQSQMLNIHLEPAGLELAPLSAV